MQSYCDDQRGFAFFPAVYKPPVEAAEGEGDDDDDDEPATDPADCPESLTQSKREILKEVEALVAKFGKGNKDDLFDGE